MSPSYSYQYHDLIIARVSFSSSTISTLLFARATNMNATQAVLDWITAHPYQTAFHVVNGVIMCTPAAATVPFLSALGYGASGPIAGTFGAQHFARWRSNASSDTTARISSGFDPVFLFLRACWRPLCNGSECSHGRLWCELCCWRSTGGSSVVINHSVASGAKFDRRLNYHPYTRPHRRSTWVIIWRRALHGGRPSMVAGWRFRLGISCE